MWTYAVADALIEKRVWMEPSANTTYVRYQVLRARGPVGLQLRLLVNYRDYHATTRSDGWRMDIASVTHGFRVIAYGGARPLLLLADRGDARIAHTWYRGFDLSRERERGLDAEEDHLHAATFQASLEPCETLTPRAVDGARAVARRRAGLGPSRPSRNGDSCRLVPRPAGGRARTGLDRPAGAECGPVRRAPSARRRSRRPDGERRLSLVRRLGTRHDDRAARPRADDPPAGGATPDPHDVRAIRGPRDAAEPLSRRRRSARVQHRRRHALVFRGDSRVSRGDSGRRAPEGALPPARGDRPAASSWDALLDQGRRERRAPGVG